MPLPTDFGLPTDGYLLPSQGLADPECSWLPVYSRDSLHSRKAATASGMQLRVTSNTAAGSRKVTAVVLLSPTVPCYAWAGRDGCSMLDSTLVRCSVLASPCMDHMAHVLLPAGSCCCHKGCCKRLKSLTCCHVDGHQDVMTHSCPDSCCCF